MQIPPGKSSLHRLLPLGAAAAALLAPAVSLQAARTAYYQFENAAEPGLDSAGGDDSATQDGGERLTTVPLAGTGAWVLDGKTPGFTISPDSAVDADFSATGNFTVSAWFRVSGATGRQRIFAASPGWGLAVDFDQSEPRILMTSYTVEDMFFTVPEIVTGKWYHVAVVVTPPDQEGFVRTRAFLNGEVLSEEYFSPYNSITGSLLIGSGGNGHEGFNGALDELAYYDNALSDGDVQAIYSAGALDTDQDGIPDYWETAVGLNPNSAADASQDLDQDGLSNKEEYDRGLLGNNPDTDGDGLKDGVEDGGGIYISATQTGTDPKNPDSDGDTILDGAEKAVTAEDPHSTDPNNADTDGDGLPDNYEIFVGKTDPTNALDPAPIPNLVAEYRFELPNFPGLDSAGGDDSATRQGGAVVTTGALAGTGAYSLDGTTAGLTIGSGSSEVDADFTSIVDNFTISAWCRVGNPTGRQRILSGGGWGLGLDFATPVTNVLMTAYGKEDKYFVTPDIIAGKWAHIAVVVTPDDGSGNVYTRVYVNGVFIREEDGIYDPAANLGIGSSSGGSTGEAFSGLLDEIRFYDTALPEAGIQALYAVGNSDDDKDGMPANWERAYGLNPEDPADAAGDPDGDGLSNLTEYTMGLLPNNPDTDGDGISDGAEDGGGVYVSATQTGTDPKKVDTDGDGIPDGAEDRGGVYVSATQTGTDPNKPDTDGDGYPDGYEVTVLHTDPTDPADPNRPRGLVAHYDFEDSENLGADSAGGDDTATAQGSAYQVTGSEAKIGDGALLLGTEEDYLNIGAGDLLADIDFRATENFSSAVWFKFDSAEGRQRILSSSPGWGLGVNFLEGTPPGLLLTSYGVKDSYFPVDLNPGEWHHVAFSVSALNGASAPVVTMYLNGESLGEDSFTFNPGTGFFIGGHGTHESFTGVLDDLRYYNTAISGAEAAALYAMGGGVVADPSFRITSLSRTNGLVSLTFASQAGAGYTVQRSAGLSGWVNVGTVNATGASASWTETTAPPAGSTHYFYRVVRNG